MDPGRIAVRAIVAFVYLLYSTRVSGKRVVAQATAFDFVVALILGDLVDDALWAEVPLTNFAAAVTSIFLADVIVKWAAFRSAAVHRIVAGRPRVALRDGVRDRKELRLEQMNAADLAAALRLQGIDKWEEVRLGLVEIDGEVSALKHRWAEPVQKSEKDGVKP